MPRYLAVAHVQWELPFPLRLPPQAFLCWEPGEGVGAFVSAPNVGTLSWSRASNLLTAADVFADAGPGALTFPTHDYRVASVLASGREIMTAELTRGPAGGFQEPRPHSIANVCLCLRATAESWADAAIARAAAALNNVIDIYRFLTLDPLARSIDGHRDTYYTLVSMATVPADWPEGSPQDVLLRLDELHFGTTLGIDRVHRIGANSYDDLILGGALPQEHLNLFTRLVGAQHELDLFHHLVFDAIRRLKRFEWALAVFDAQSAFEVQVATVLTGILTRRGVAAADIETQFAPRGGLDSLQRRLVEIDRAAETEATAAGVPSRQFLGSQAETAWRYDLYRVRHTVVHEGVRHLTFDIAKRALQAGLRAAFEIQDLRPSFNRPFVWTGDVLNLSHLTQSAGRLSRIFEA